MLHCLVLPWLSYQRVDRVENVFFLKRLTVTEIAEGLSRWEESDEVGEVMKTSAKVLLAALNRSPVVVPRSS